MTSKPLHVALGTMPIVRVRGNHREAGEQYGRAARGRILRCLERYAAVYQEFAGWSWERARLEAEAFVDAIEEFSPASMEQIRGIAAGSGLDTLDILAINLRTEILFAGQARSLEKTARLRGECSIFTFVDEVSGLRFSAQNWDWIPFAADTVILLEVDQDDVSYATVVEAGLLAKFGLNSAGIALTTNALVSKADRGSPGIPYHVMLHSLITSQNIDEARGRLTKGLRSSSASYLLLDSSGTAVGAETRPGDATSISWSDATSCEVTHTNHFMHDQAQQQGDDLAQTLIPDSAHRLSRIQQPFAGAGADGRMSVAEAKALLSDHDGHPNSVCCHPDPIDAELRQGLTVAAAIIDPANFAMDIAVGPPCGGQWHSLRYRERWRNVERRVGIEQDAR